MQLKYQNLNETVQSFITTCEQKTKDVSEMFTNNSKTLEDIKDKSESMKSHVESMEKDWPSIRDSTFSHNITITLLRTNIEELRNTTKLLDSSISELRSKMIKVKNDKKKDELSFLDDPSKLPIVQEGNSAPNSDVNSTAAVTIVPTTIKLKPGNM